MNRQIYEINASLLFKFEFNYNEANFITITRFSFIKTIRAMSNDYERFKIAQNKAFNSLIIEKSKIKKAQNSRLLIKAFSIAIIASFSTKITLALLEYYKIFKIVRNTTFSSLIIKKTKIEQAHNYKLPNLDYN